MAFNVNDSRITGLALSVAANGQTVSVSNGVAYLPNTGRILLQDSMSVTVTAVTNAWRHFYLANDAGVLKFEASGTAPGNPYQGTARTKSNDVTRRYIGSLYFGAAGTTLPFLHSQPGDRANRIDYLASGGLSLAAAALLNLGISTTAVKLSASTMVPATCRLMNCFVQNTTGLVTAYLTTGDTAASASNWLLAIPPGASFPATILMNGSQELSYIMGTGLITVGGLTIKVGGYIFDR